MDLPTIQAAGDHQLPVHLLWRRRDREHLLFTERRLQYGASKARKREIPIDHSGPLIRCGGHHRVHPDKRGGVNRWLVHQEGQDEEVVHDNVRLKHRDAHTHAAGCPQDADWVHRVLRCTHGWGEEGLAETPQNQTRCHHAVPEQLEVQGELSSH